MLPQGETSLTGEGEMATGVCTQGEGLGVRAHSVGRFSPCCFLAGTSPAEDAAGRDAWLGAGRHGAQGGKVRSSPRAELQADTFVWEAYGR